MVYTERNKTQSLTEIPSLISWRYTIHVKVVHILCCHQGSLWKAVLRTFSHSLKSTLARAEHSAAPNDPDRVAHHISAPGRTDCDACPTHGDSVSKGKANNLSVRSETAAASDWRGSFWRLRQEYHHVSEESWAAWTRVRTTWQSPASTKQNKAKGSFSFLSSR